MSETIHADARHEIKFVADATRYHELENWIRVNGAGFVSPYPRRRVNNVYFDTPDLFTFAENLSGSSARSKVRLRWYGETLRPEASQLEVKRRRNQLGWKHNYPGPALDFATGSWRELRSRIRRALSPKGRVWFDAHPQPVLMNRYYRQYFEAPEGKIRATLDYRQRVFDQRLRGRPNLQDRANLPDTLVVEIKFRPSDFKLGSQVIAGIPIRVSRNSKYMIGVESILGPLRT